MQKIYYNPVTKLEIVDLSGKKPFEEIKAEFGEDVISTPLVIDEKKEGYKIKNGKLEKIDLINKERFIK